MIEINTQNWDRNKEYCEKTLKSSPCYIATTDKNGIPYITPFGSLLFNEDQKGYICELFSNNCKKNMEQNNNICIMIIRSSKWLWVKALSFGQFHVLPGIRLIGTVSEMRKGTAEEEQRLRKIVRPYKMFKGYNLLWKNMGDVRDIHFDYYEPIRLGNLTSNLYDFT